MRRIHFASMIFLSLFTMVVEADGGMPLVLEGHSRGMVLRNTLPVDVLVLMGEDSADASGRLRAVRIGAGNTVKLGGLPQLRDVVPVWDGYRPSHRIDCSSVQLGGDLRVGLESLFDVDSLVSGATFEARDLQSEAMRLKVDAAMDSFFTTAQDPRWLRAADTAIESGNYVAANQYLAADRLQTQTAAMTAFAEMAGASMEVDAHRRAGYGAAADQMAFVVDGLGKKLEETKTELRRIERQVDAQAAFNQLIFRAYEQAASSSVKAGAVRRLCAGNAVMNDVLLIDAEDARLSRVRVDFDRGGSVQTIAFPAKEKQDILIVRIPVPVHASEAEVRIGSRRLGRVALRQRSLVEVVDNLKNSHRQARKEYRSARYRHQGGDILDSGAAVW